jgi:hypothetical protein
VANGNIDGFNVGLGAEGGSNNFVVVIDGLPVASVVADGFVFADVWGFSNADAGDLTNDTQVAGKAEASGVNVAVAVAQQEVWFGGEAGEGF